MATSDMREAPHALTRPRKAEADPLPDEVAVLPFARGEPREFAVHRVGAQPAGEAGEPLLDTLLGPPSQLATQPLALRCLERPLGRFGDARGEQLLRQGTQQPLADAAADLPLGRLAERQLDEAVVEERLAQLDGRPHRDPV